MWSLALVAQLAWSLSICAARQSFQHCCMLTMSPCQGSSACKHECVCSVLHSSALISKSMTFFLKVMDEGEMQCKQACWTYSSLSLFLVLLVFLRASSAPILMHAEPLEGQQLTPLSAHAGYLCTLDGRRHTHVRFAMQSCDSSSLPPTSAWFAATITRRSCRSSICGWC